MEMFNLLIIVLVLFSITVVSVILFIKQLMLSLNNVCKWFRWFISENSGFFKIFFILVFFLEQIIFIFILYRYFNVSKAVSTFIGAFALVVVTTASLQVFVWEHKYYEVQQKNKGLEQAIQHSTREETYRGKVLEMLRKKL